MTLNKFWLKIGGEWFKVTGLVLPSGWLEWKDTDGSSGLAQPVNRDKTWMERKKGERKPPMSAS